jgi:membrane-associated phospholipid phosphatase
MTMTTRETTTGNNEVRTFNMTWKLNIAWIVSLLLLWSATLSGEEKLHPFFVPRPDFYELQSAAVGVDESQPTSPNLIRQIGIDFKNVFTTKENLVIAGVGLGLAWAASPLDDDISESRFNTTTPNGSLNNAFEPGTVLGSAALHVGGAFATYGLGKLFSNQGVEALGRDLVRAQIVTQSLTQVLKFTVRRERPDGSSNRSFPSGHSSGSFATATVLQRHYGWKVGIPAYAVAGYVATSRLNQGKHYLSDVIFGAAIGVLVGRTVTVDLGGNRFTISPMVVPAGAGVQFSLLGAAR